MVSKIDTIIDTVTVIDKLIQLSTPIDVRLIDKEIKTDWSLWFLTIAVLSLIAAVLVPFFMKKYEEKKAKYGYHLYIKKKIGVVYNFLTYDKHEYTKLNGQTDIEKDYIVLEKLTSCFYEDGTESGTTTNTYTRTEEVE